MGKSTKEKRKISPYAKEKIESNDNSEKLVGDLKDKACNNRIKLPNYISFILEEDSTILLYIQEQIANNGEILNALSKNMQGDNAAFEGWAIVLKAWCPEKASKVRLKWDVPSSGNSNPHYRRFCYRVIKMCEAYEWFSVDEINKNDIEQFKEKELIDLQNNCGNTIPQKKYKGGGEIGENAIEYDMVHVPDFSRKMCEKYDVENINHQLPVGVKNKHEDPFFAGSKAAIDLWGMRGHELTIIELKYENKMVGIISELFFYVNIIRDIIKGNIAKPTAVLACEKELYMRINGMKCIHGRMLADIYHPLIKDEKVLNVLNSSKYIDVPIDYNYDTYKYTPSSLEFI